MYSITISFSVPGPERIKLYFFYLTCCVMCSCLCFVACYASLSFGVKKCLMLSCFYLSFVLFKVYIWRSDAIGMIGFLYPISEYEISDSMFKSRHVYLSLKYYRHCEPHLYRSLSFVGNNCTASFSCIFLWDI